MLEECLRGIRAGWRSPFKEGVKTSLADFPPGIRLYIWRLTLKTTFLGCCLLLVCGGVLSAGTITFTVLGTDSPFLSGDGNTKEYVGLPLTAGTFLQFSVTGSAHYDACPCTATPDGSTSFTGGTSSAGIGISNVLGNYDGLFGVFVGDVRNSTAPATLDFRPSASPGMDFESLSPLLQQVFFIGDGLTGTGTGTSQDFFVPTGATHLYLGMLDGSGWYNNGGSFSVTINDPALEGSTSSTPEPGSVTMMIGAGLLGLGFRFKKHRVAWINRS
jgi:hypothetical protein